MANAGLDQTLNDANEDGVVTVVLDGRRSEDPDGMIIGYEWRDGSGSLLSTEPLYALILGGGSRTITLRVTDCRTSAIMGHFQTWN